MFEPFDFKEEMPINAWALDEELVDQGRKMMGMVESYGEAILQRDRAKLRCDVVFASLSQKVRKSPTEYGLDSGRPSDQTVTNVVTAHPLYIKARQRHILLSKEAEVLKAGVSAFQDRSQRIGRLVQLHLNGYLGRNPQIPVEKGVEQSTENQQRSLLTGNPRMQQLRDKSED